MSATKSQVTIFASGTVTAATPSTSTEADLSTKYGGLLTLKITNGATAPTLPCNAYVYTGGATGVKKLFMKCAGDTVNSSVNEFAVEIPWGVMFLNVVFQDNTVQNVTAEALLQQLTTV